MRPAGLAPGLRLKVKHNRQDRFNWTMQRSMEPWWSSSGFRSVDDNLATSRASPRQDDRGLA